MEKTDDIVDAYRFGRGLHIYLTPRQEAEIQKEAVVRNAVEAEEIRREIKRRLK